MDSHALLLTVPLFFILYGAVDVWTSGKKRNPSGARHTHAPGRSGLHGLLSALGHTGLNRWALEHLGWRDRFENLLLAAGHPYRWKAEEVLAFKEVMLLFAALLVGIADLGEVWAWPVALLVGFFIPELWLKASGDARKATLQRQLPVYVDLLSLALESGLDLLVSTERIQEKMKAGPLRDELQLMVQEYRLGTSRKEVLVHWSQRLDLPDATSLSSLIIQSDEIGGDLPTVLRSYAEDMRTRRFLRAEELAGKIPVKILFPMVIFFFPIVFVIILGPIALEFMGQMR